MITNHSMARNGPMKNPSRERDKPVIHALGLTQQAWYHDISARDRKRYREIWANTPEQDRMLPPEAWQLKYLGCIFIRPQLPHGPEKHFDKHGNEITHYPNGDVVTTYWHEGIEIIRRASGKTEIVTDAINGIWRHIRYPNGTTIRRRSEMGGDRYVMQIEYPNGKIITQADDGRDETQYPTGATILRSADGSEVLHLNGEVIELAPPVKGWEDVPKNRRRSRFVTQERRGDAE